MKFQTTEGLYNCGCLYNNTNVHIYERYFTSLLFYHGMLKSKAGFLNRIPFIYFSTKIEIQSKKSALINWTEVFVSKDLTIIVHIVHKFNVKQKFCDDVICKRFLVFGVPANFCDAKCAAKCERLRTTGLEGTRIKTS